MCFSTSSYKACLAATLRKAQSNCLEGLAVSSPAPLLTRASERYKGKEDANKLKLQLIADYSMLGLILEILLIKWGNWWGTECSPNRKSTAVNERKRENLSCICWSECNWFAVQGLQMGEHVYFAVAAASFRHSFRHKLRQELGWLRTCLLAPSPAFMPLRAKRDVTFKSSPSLNVHTLQPPNRASNSIPGSFWFPNTVQEKGRSPSCAF